MTERKVAGFELKRLDEQGQFVGRLARLNAIDRDGDVTLRGAFGNDQVAPVLVSHDWSQIPRGKAQIREEGDEVLAYGKINLALDAGRSLYEMLKFDMSHGKPETEFSYGFIAETVEPGLFEGQRVRFLKRVRVLEVSVVVAGAGDTALVMVKGASEDRDRALLAHLQSLPPEQQQPWLNRAQGLCAEARVLLLGSAFDDLFAGKVFYRYVAPGQFEWRDRLGKDALAAACIELGCARPKRVQFFTSTDEEHADFMDTPHNGSCTKDRVIGLSWNLAPGELLEVAAHEAAHLGGLDEQEAEAFARDFARRHSTTLLGASPRPGGLSFEQVAALAGMTKLLALTPDEAFGLPPTRRGAGYAHARP